MKRALVVLTALLLPAGLAGAQAKENQKPTQQQRVPREATEVYQLRHVDPDALSEVLNVFPAEIRADQKLKVIAVSGSKETVAAIGEVIKRLDVAPKARNLELTFYMLAASRKQLEGPDLPETLTSVAKQLGQIFGYAGIELLETAVVRLREGSGARTSGSLRLMETESPEPPGTYTLRVKRAELSGNGDARQIRIDDLSLGLRIQGRTSSGGYAYRDAGFSTNIDLREGQKAVVGKANVEGGGRDFILVVTGKVLE